MYRSTNLIEPPCS